MGIKEIAKEAGVSKTTVSLALNGHKGVSDKTRSTILEIARKMNYRLPSERIITQTSKGFIMFARLNKHGLILNRDQSSFIMDYIDSINEAVTEAGYTFEILDHTFTTVSALTNLLSARKPKGIIILGTELDEEDVNSLQSLPFTFVVIDTQFETARCDFVDMANVNALTQAITHLVEYGHREIGMISCTTLSGNISLREQGFTLGLERANLPVNKDYFLRIKPGFKEAYQDMNAYLQTNPTLPQAFFCYNDVAALGVIKALKEHKIRIPEDISIVGFDNLPMSSMSEPRLTTIKVPNRLIGTLATELLVDKLSTKRSKEPITIQVKGTLVVRDSVMDRN
ncbi:MAG: LacI family DNA-binding transcriptional regulator [Sphaerochaeta sp.]